MKEFSININGLPVKAVYNESDIDRVFIPLLKLLTDMYRNSGKRQLVYLAAPPGAGKSTLAGFLEHLSLGNGELEDIQAIGMDGFHRRQEYLLSHTMTRDGREIPMIDVKGAYETFDFDKLHNAIKSVLSADVCYWPTYDRLSHNPVEDAITVNKNIVLLEGNYLMLDIDPWESLSSYAAYTISVMADEDMLRKRLISRRIASGHPAERAAEFVDYSDMYNARICLEHSKKSDLMLRIKDDGSYEKIVGKNETK
jgi:hypothetical protein